jgi:hypothetical protein
MIAIAFMLFFIACIVIVYGYERFQVVSIPSAPIGRYGPQLNYYSDNGSLSSEAQYARNGTFKGNLTIEADSRTMLIGLLDYHVIPIYYNNSVNLTHLIDPSSYDQENKTYDAGFSVTNISRGFHDVMLVAFMDPYNNTNAKWGYDGPIRSSSMLFTVLSDNSTKAMPAFNNDSVSDGTQYTTGYYFDGALITDTPFNDTTWFEKNVNDNQAIGYYLNIGNPIHNANNTTRNFAVVQLMDYAQIPINDGSSSYVYYGSLKSGESAALHMSFNAPDATGSHKLVVIVIEEPYENTSTSIYGVDYWILHKAIDVR